MRKRQEEQQPKAKAKAKAKEKKNHLMRQEDKNTQLRKISFLFPIFCRIQTFRYTIPSNTEKGFLPAKSSDKDIGNINIVESRIAKR